MRVGRVGFLDMSRRARRKRGGSKNWFGKFVVVLGVILIVGFGAAFFGLRAYLHSEGFRSFLATLVSNGAKIEGNFKALKWDGFAVETEGYEGRSEGVVSSLKVDRISTEVGFGALNRGAWEIKATRISRIDVSLDLTKEAQAVAVETEVEKVEEGGGWLPDKVELESLEVGEIAMDAKTKTGMIEMDGVSLKVFPERGFQDYKAEVTGGEVRFPMKWAPALRVEKIEGTYRDGSVFVTRGDVGAWKDGRLSCFGEYNFEKKYFAFEGDVDRVRCDEVLSEDWAKKLTGDVSSSYAVSNRTGNMVVSGELKVENGVLTAMPVLDALAAYAETRRFRVLQLNEARVKWRYANGELSLSDLVLGSDGLIRLEGNMVVKDRKVDGRFRLGLVPGTLSTIPGAETHVFMPGTHGLLWAPLHITGTLDDPKEDLTNRLVEAAGLRMFEQIPETGEQVLKFTRNALGETPAVVIEQGRVLLDAGGKVIENSDKLIDGGEKVIEEAEGIFRGLLGN